MTTNLQILENMIELAKQQQETQRQLEVLRSDYLRTQAIADEANDPAYALLAANEATEAKAAKNDVFVINMIKLIEEVNKPYVAQLEKIAKLLEDLEWAIRMRS